MRFIELFSSFSPDGGSGLVEAIVLATLGSCLMFRGLSLRPRKPRKSC